MKLDILHNMVKGMVKFLPFYLFTFLPLNAIAQTTFTQRVQQQTVGEGTVTIHHDAAIDELVNGPAETPARKTVATTKPATPKKQQDTTTAKQDAKDPKDTAPQNPKAAQQGVPTTTADSVATTTTGGPRHTYKATGYRVQVFAGGNTRNDRRRAEQTGNALRQLFPGEEVYVHFYSPRWICRMGNYRTFQEAHDVMAEVKKLGYESATVVKGKITLTR